MGARKKLNAGAILGSLLLSGLIGCFTSSWLVFIIAALILLVLSLYVGDIRPGKRGW